MNQPTPSAHALLAAVDFSEGSRLALQQAWVLAAQRPDAELHIGHVIPSGSLDQNEQLLDQAPAAIRDFASQASQGLARLPRPYVTHVRIGSVAPALLQLAVDIDAAMIVVASHGRSLLERTVMGSVSRALIDAGRLPILVSRPKDLAGMARTAGLEPPCPACVLARTSRGERWCDLHGRKHVPVHGAGTATPRRVRFTRAPMDVEGPAM